MNSDRWLQIESIYNSALQLEATERNAFLDCECGKDDELRQEVLALLTSADCADSFLNEPVVNLGLSVINQQQLSIAGTNVDRYKLLELLGRGGMGEVYLAHDSTLNRHVALKLLLDSFTDDRERVRRFEQEARAASAISHPNVAHIYEVGEGEGRRYISMEYVDGYTLRHILKKGALGVSVALDIASQMAAALAAAHAVGVVHRDIKPENVMVRHDGYVKVLDFGLAKLVESRLGGLDSKASLISSLHTEPELLMGTSNYMSPEQLRREPVDLRTDLWSLTVVLYEMLVARRPFPGKAISEVIVSILERDPEPLEYSRLGFPLALNNIVLKALQKDPAERYQSAESFLGDIRTVNRQIEKDRDLRRFDDTPGSTREANTVEATESPLRTNEARDSTTTKAIDRPTSFTQLNIESKAKTSKRKRFVSIRNSRAQLLLVIFLSVAGIGLFFGLSRGLKEKLQSRHFDLRFERVNLSGNITDLVISPDGKYIAYIVVEEGKKAIHIVELATASDLRIVPPSKTGYSGLAFSPEGNYVYFIENQTETGTLYRVSKLGGGLRKILTNINTSVTFSPDGRHISFVRYNISEETPDVIIAQADGTSERTLTRRTRADAETFPADMSGVGPTWSPDGSVLICPTVNFSRNPREMNLDVVDVSNGSSRRLTSMPSFDISRVTWLADGSGIMMAAKQSPNSPWQLTLLAYPNGEIREVTNDPNNYVRVSGTSDSSLFLTLNVEENSSIWLVSKVRQAQIVPVNISQKKGVVSITWRGDGKLFSAVSDGKNTNFWTQDANGTPANQLTFDPSDNSKAAFSPDQRYVVFVSSRGGMSNIWRMDADGTEAKQLTFGAYDDMPSVTPDGNWVFYRTGKGINKVPIGGGEHVKLISLPDRSALYPSLSPDGRLLAVFTNEQRDSKKWILQVINLQTLVTVKQFELPEATRPFSGLRWTPDGRALSYVSSASGSSNLWLQPLVGGESKQLTEFKDAELISFDWSADGERVVCVRSMKTHIPILVRLF